MTSRSFVYAAAALATLALSGCGNARGRPGPDSARVDPDKILDFGILYGQNCAGCHGQDGRGGAAIALADPIYLAIADDSILRRSAADGIAGTSMPAFAKSAGGMLTDEQIDVIVSGIRSRWSRPDALQGANPPPYSSSEPGDASAGLVAYAKYCSSCHGPGGRGGLTASSIVDGSFLALLTDQELRTIVIVGRPELGAPDWRGNVPGNPMSAEDISNVVAWLASQRAKFPGQPYPNRVPPTGEIR